MNQINQLTDDGDDSNLAVVQTTLMVEFNKLFGEFCELNTSVKALLSGTPGEEMKADQEGWFTHKADMFHNFTLRAETWIRVVQQRIAEADRANEEVAPEDSASVVTVRKKKGSKAPSSTCSRASSSASSARLKAELERAELQAQASALKQKRLLDEQEVKLKADREELQIQTALAASNAKFRVLDELEGLRASSGVSHEDGMDSYFRESRVPRNTSSQTGHACSPRCS